MKTTTQLFAIILLMFAASCGNTGKVTIENTSANQQVKVVLNAERLSALDPYKVNLNVKAYDFKEGQLQFEIMASSLDTSNVKFNWTDDNNCLITITERDGKPRSFQLIADANQVQLAEI
jgi:hypothetical protein